MIKRIFISIFFILLLIIGGNYTFAVSIKISDDGIYYSPLIDNNYIFYTNSSDAYKIYRMNKDGTGRVKLTDDYTYGYIRMDDNYIFYGNSADGGSLYRMNKDGTGRVKIVTASVLYHNTIGNYIVYTNGSMSSKLYRVNKDGTGNIKLTDDNVSFSITDSNFIFYKNNSDGNKLYKINKDGTGRTKLNDDALATHYNAIDDNYIYYSNVSDGNKLYKINKDGTGRTKLNDENSIYPVVDGNYIYYTNGGDYKIYRVNKDGTGRVKVTDDNAFYKAFSENYIYYPRLYESNKLYKLSTLTSDQSNGSYQHYILNRLTATEGNMKNLNNTAPNISFSNYNTVKNNFLANYQYRKSWYEAKGLTSEVLSKNVKWNEGVIFSKSDLAGGMLNDYKISANYDFMSDDEMDNVDSSIFWRGNLSSTSFQTDETWNTVGLPAYIIRNQNGNIVGYLQYPCGNLICKDKGCTDIKNIINGTVTVNKAPTPTFSSFSVNKNAKYVSVLTATDPEKDTLTYSKTISANHGTVIILANGTFGYQPVTNYVGTDTFTYSVSDGKNPGVSKQVNITVNDIVPTNTPPVPTFSSFYTNKNTAYNGNLTATDVNGDTLTYNVVTTSKKGTLNVSSNGSFTYTPNSYYVGSDSFIYSVTDGKSSAVTKTVSIMVNDYIAGNVAPTPTFSSLTTNKNIKFSGVLTSTDPDGGTLYYSLVSNANNGTINIGSNGNFTYTPSNGYVGSDSFIYSVSDGYNASVNKNVTIGVNDVVSNNPPNPTFNALFTNKNTSYNGYLTASDNEGNPLVFGKVSNPLYGTLTTQTDGYFTYTPSNGYVGSDSFIYSVSDGYNASVKKLVTIQVNDVIEGNTPPVVDNIPPITVDKNNPINTIIDTTDPDGDTIIYTPITQPENGTITIDENGNINYIPDEGFSGTEEITIGIGDGVNPPVEKVIKIIVNDPVVGNFPPVAIFSGFSTGKNKVYNDTLTAIDPENDILTFSLLSQALNGIVIINSNGTFSYTPNNGYSGTDVFTYAVLDGHNNPVSGTVNITIIPSIDTIWNEPTAPDNEKDIFCTATNNGTTTSKTILVLNPKADTEFIQKLKGKSEYLKTISASGTINNFDKIVEDVVKEKVKSSKLNQKSNLYDFGSGGTITGIQYNLTKIPNSAVMRKLVDLAIDHSTVTMSNYTQTMKENCSSSTSVNSETIPAGFIEVNEKGETILNLFRFNGN